MTNLLVGNLASNRTPDDIRRVFATYGPVERVEIVTDPETRYSCGYAPVEMTNDLEAKKAISHSNGVTRWGSQFEWKSFAPAFVETDPTKLDTLIKELARIVEAQPTHLFPDWQSAIADRATFHSELPALS